MFWLVLLRKRVRQWDDYEARGDTADNMHFGQSNENGRKGVVVKLVMLEEC